jgi:cobalt-zinc-cadmium efflux system membrane fusion protein
MRRLVLLLALALVPACGKSPVEVRPSPSEAPALQLLRLNPDTLARLGVVVEQAGGEAAVHRVELPGTLEYVADKYAEVGYLAEGRITSVRVNVGDKVKRGQPLATLLIPQISDAQAQALSAQANLDIARDHARREAALLEDKLTSKRDEELARGQKRVAEADLAGAKAKLALLGADVPEGTGELRSHGHVTLTSPIDGVVVARDATLGAFVEPRDTVFAIADTRTMWAVLDVFESDVGSAREGTPVELTVDALGGKIVKGKIVALEPQVTHESRALRARVEVPNEDGALRRGLFVRASLPIASADSAELLLPKSAVQPLGGRDVVFVEKERGVFEVRTVTTAPRSAQLLRITDGLHKDERIVARGAFVLRGEATKQ